MNKKILVIEDNPSTARLTVLALEHEGYEVIVASDGLEGLAKAQDEHPDLIVLDIMLPGMDGFEICHHLRTESLTARIPILMLSGKSDAVDKAMGLRLGADDYISKPWHRSDLVSKVASILERGR